MDTTVTLRYIAGCYLAYLIGKKGIFNLILLPTN